MIVKIDHEKTYDAIVVGSGLTGGWAAKELSEAGLEVLVLEAGPLRSIEEIAEVGCWTTERRLEACIRQPIQCRNPSYWRDSPTLFVDDLDNPYTTDTNFTWIRGRQVGGRSLTWRAVTLRFSDFEFTAPERDGLGAPWPLGYQELAPFYDEVEKFMHVQGSKESLPQLPDGIFEPPPELTEWEGHFKRQVEAKWTDRKVIISRGIPLNQDPSSGSKIWPRQSSLGSTLPAAIATGRTFVRPDSIVSHLVVDSGTDRIKYVECVDRSTKQSFAVSSRIVMLCASTLESIRIMLNSKSARHPNGVGNSSGLLGCFLCDHMGVTLGGPIHRGNGLNVSPLGGAHGICIPRFRNLSEESRDFVRGYGIAGHMQRAASNGLALWTLWSMLETLPRKDNKAQIDDDKVDAWGLKAIRVHFAYSENEFRMKQDAELRILEMVNAAGLDVYQHLATWPGEFVHELGGARMGNNSSTSILNRFNQCWDAKNLFVSDGSCFVTAGWQNPSLTMMALTVRACDFIVQELKRGNI